MKVEIQWRWLAVSLSVITLVLLRNHKLWLVAYAITVVVLIAAAIVLLPRLVARAEKHWNHNALRLLASGDLEGLSALAERQRFLRLTGRRWVVDEVLARGAIARKDGDAACKHLTAALERCPAAQQQRLELALANAEHLSGAYATAEGRLRAMLGKPHPGLDPRPLLAKVLLEQDPAHADEAVALIRAALPTAEPHTRPGLKAELERAQRHTLR
jgi:hypothetical protein